MTVFFDSVCGGAVGVWVATKSNPAPISPKQEVCSHSWQKVELVFSECWTPPGQILHVMKKPS